jgi:hypothetical protein
MYSIGNNAFSDISKIGYVEIVDQNGRVQSQEKIRVQNGLSSGAIEIPETIASGNYIIRGYTLWSKNNQLAQACVQPIHILNTSDKNIYQYKSQNVVSNNNQNNNTSLSFNGLNTNYTTKTSIAFSISNKEASPSNFLTGSLSIFKVDSIQPEALITNSVNATNASATIIIPELVGHRISGTIQVKGSKDVLTNERVYISIPGNIGQFKVTQTDSKGHFTFDVPNFVDQNIVIIQTENDQKKIQIVFDPASTDIKPYHFTTNGSPTPFTTFKTLLDHHIAKEVQSVYTYSKDAQFEKITFDTSSFYNKPDVSYKLDDYVRFASLEETFVEFIPEVSVESKKGHFSIYAYDFQSKNFFRNKPLVLVNGIPVFNLDRLFEYDPTRFKKIDIIGKSYIYGDQVFNGIINLVTYDGQIEANTLIDNDFVFELKGIQKHLLFQNTSTLSSSAYNDRFPDYRTTLLWIPQVVLKGTDVKIETSASELKGMYKVLFRGIDNKGLSKEFSQLIQID